MDLLEAALRARGTAQAPGGGVTVGSYLAGMCLMYQFHQA